MMQYIYDFLSIFFDKLKDSGKIRAIILFGSVARGNPKKDSDIDIFVDTNEKDKEELDAIAKEALNEFEFKASTTWHVRGIANPINIIVDSLNADKWSELKREIAAHGLILFGKYVGERVGGKQKVIIEYDLSKIKQKNKMKLMRKLHGYQIKKNRKVYSQKGLLDIIKGEKMHNAIIVDITDYKSLADLLKEHKIPLKRRTIWTG